MKLTKLFLVIGMILILPASVLGLTAGDTQAYYKLENSGFNYIDSTPTGADITSGSAPIQSTGIINYGQDYSGDRTWTSTTITTGGSGSVNIWFNADNEGGGSRMFFDANDGSARTFMYWYGNQGAYNFLIDGTSVFGNTMGGVGTGSWKMVTMTWTPTAQTLYLDGIPIAFDTATLSTTSFTTTYVGCHNSGADCWDGDLDELSIWNSTLSGLDVMDLYNGGAPTSNQQYPYAPSNTYPQITDIANQVIFEDTSLENVLFNVTDTEDAPATLVVTSWSSNEALVLNSSILLGGTNGERHLNLTPIADQFGNTTINVTVTDTGGLTNSTTFNLEVLNVNDAPSITPINDKTMVSNQTLTIGFNVTDIDNLFTDLSYTASFSDASLFTNFTFSNFNTSAQEFNITAGLISYGNSEINISVSDGEFSNSTLFLMTVNCNTSVYNPSGTPYDNPPTSVDLIQSCYIIDVSFDGETDILNYNFTDFGGTSNRSFIYVYKTTGGMNQEITYETTNNLSATWYFDYSATYPNDDFTVYGWSRFTERNVTGEVLPADIQVFKQSYSQVATLNTFFSKSDGLMYALLILVLFATIGVASQSATLSLILSVVGLWLASKFVLNVPEEFLWIAGALVMFVIYYIAKLRVD